MSNLPDYVSNQLSLSIGILITTATNVRVMPADESRCYVSAVVDTAHLVTVMKDGWDFHHIGNELLIFRQFTSGKQFALRMDRVLSCAKLQYKHACVFNDQYREEPQRMYFEWLKCNADCSLSISVPEDGSAIEYMKAWPKTNATSPADLEFEEGYVTDDAQIVELWKWLEEEQ